jgi:hypothetical protein
MSKLIRLIIGALCVVALFSTGCEDDDPGKRDWIVVSDVSGTWIAETSPDAGGRQLPEDALQERFRIQQRGNFVSGRYSETHRDGSIAEAQVHGRYDSQTGIVVLDYDSETYGFLSQPFRFTSDTVMFKVFEHDTTTGHQEFNKQ